MRRQINPAKILVKRRYSYAKSRNVIDACMAGAICAPNHTIKNSFKFYDLAEEIPSQMNCALYQNVVELRLKCGVLYLTK